MFLLIALSIIDFHVLLSGTMVKFFLSTTLLVIDVHISGAFWDEDNYDSYFLIHMQNQDSGNAHIDTYPLLNGTMCGPSHLRYLVYAINVLPPKI